MCGLCEKTFKVEVPKLYRRKNKIENTTLKVKRRVLSKQSSIPRTDNFSAKYLSMLMKLGYKKGDALDKIRQVQSLNLKNEQEIINRLVNDTSKL